MMVELLFVYGSLRSNAGHAMHRALARASVRVGPATFRGRLYFVSWYPGAVASASPMDLVQGEVYRLRDTRRMLAFFDDYEGCNAANSEFERCLVDVVLDGGLRARAWIYSYREPTRGLERIMSGDFLQAKPVQRSSRA